MTAEYASDWRVDSLYSQCADHGYLHDLAGNILRVPDPEAPVEHRLALMKAEHPLMPDFLDQRRHHPVLHKVNSDQVVLGLNPVVLRLLFGNALDYRQFVLVVNQVLSEEEWLVLSVF